MGGEEVPIRPICGICRPAHGDALEVTDGFA
jgi:hypothetical protein